MLYSGAPDTDSGANQVCIEANQQFIMRATMSHQVDLNDVRNFVIAAQAGTLSAAAGTLHQPVSTISRSLTRLEKQLGILLVRRGPKGLALTDAGTEYLLSCRRGLRSLKEGEELLEAHRSNPSGTIKIMCPITMARDLLAPVLKDFVSRFPALRMEIEPYSSGFDQEPREDVDVFFKVLTPNDSLKRVRAYPGMMRGLFASPSYISEAGTPVNPMELSDHRCAGWGVWKFTNSRKKEVTPEINFHLLSSDYPGVNLRYALDGLGITLLPLYVAKHPDHVKRLVHLLPLWQPEPLQVCALFSGSSRLTPKIQTLLDFLAEYIGTDRDPRGNRTKGYFTESKI
jgi:LysR family transcriptional regulator, transcriptional activator for dmlA